MLFREHPLLFSYTIGLLLLAALEEERKQYLVEALGDIDGDIVDVILHGSLAQGGELLGHLTTIFSGHFVGLESQLMA